MALIKVSEKALPLTFLELAEDDPTTNQRLPEQTSLVDIDGTEEGAVLIGTLPAYSVLQEAVFFVAEEFDATVDLGIVGDKDVFIANENAPKTVQNKVVLLGYAVDEETPVYLTIGSGGTGGAAKVGLKYSRYT
jgi:hypothetical protein